MNLTDPQSSPLRAKTALTALQEEILGEHIGADAQDARRPRSFAASRALTAPQEAPRARARPRKLREPRQRPGQRLRLPAGIPQPPRRHQVLLRQRHNPPPLPRTGARGSIPGGARHRGGHAAREDGREGQHGRPAEGGGQPQERTAGRAARDR
jgi:hypothetical protein